MKTEEIAAFVNSIFLSRTIIAELGSFYKFEFCEKRVWRDIL